jgi:phospholipid transport system substrate-binding protein
MQCNAWMLVTTLFVISHVSAPARAEDTPPSQPPAAPAGAETAAADTGAATEAIRKANEKLRGLLGDKSDKSNKEVTKAMHGLFDIKLLAQRALVAHWEKMTNKQRTELVDTLQAIIEKNYVGQLRDNVDYKIDYLGEEMMGDSVLVKSAIRAQRNGRPSKISVDYRLKQEGGTWHIYDVVTEDVSILENYRSQFSKIIAKDGVDGLLAKMKSKLQA